MVALFGARLLAASNTLNTIAWNGWARLKRARGGGRGSGRGGDDTTKTLLDSQTTEWLSDFQPFYPSDGKLMHPANLPYCGRESLPGEYR